MEKNKPKAKIPKGYELIMVFILFILVLVIVDLFPKKDAFDYDKRELAKGIVIEKKRTKNSTSFIYEFKYKNLYYRGSVGKLKANCNVGDSCLIRFAVYDPSVSTYIETISK